MHLSVFREYPAFRLVREIADMHQGIYIYHDYVGLILLDDSARGPIPIYFDLLVNPKMTATSGTVSLFSEFGGATITARINDLISYTVDYESKDFVMSKHMPSGEASYVLPPSFDIGRDAGSKMRCSNALDMIVACHKLIKTP